MSRSQTTPSASLIQYITRHSGTDDLLQFLSMAIFMLNQAVASMQTLFEVVDLGEAAMKKEIIGEILMRVL